MNTRSIYLTLCAVTFCFSSSSPGAVVIREFQGSSSITTPEFVVKAPWLLDWRVNGDYANVIGLDIDLLDAKTGLHAGRVLKTKQAGNGVKLFDKGGRFRLRIDASLARWHIKIEEISKQEAKLYTPRGGS